MRDFEWIPEKSDENRNKKDEYATKAQKGEVDTEETKAIKMSEEKEEKEKRKDEIDTLIEPEGEPFDPFKNFAVLALVDIALEVKRRRNVPQFSHIKEPVTAIGTGKRAHIKADDLNTVEPEHGAIVFKNGQFRICPLEGIVKIDGKRVFNKEGEVLKNGSQIEMGSARFIFLTALVDENKDIILP